MVHSSNGLLYLAAIKKNEVELHELTLKRCQWLLNDRNKNKNSIYIVFISEKYKICIHEHMHVSIVHVSRYKRVDLLSLEGSKGFFGGGYWESKDKKTICLLLYIFFKSAGLMSNIYFIC